MVIVDTSDPNVYKIEVTDKYRSRLFTLPKDVNLFYVQPDVCWEGDAAPHAGVWGFSGKHPNITQHYAEYRGEDDFILT